MLWRWGYRLLVTLLLPPLLLWLWLPRRGMPRVGRRLIEFVGGGRPVGGRPLWLHAASVGEVNALLPLLKALRDRYPALPLLVTTTTATGAARVEALAITNLHHRYMPLDLPLLVRRFLARHRPLACLLTEMELWPLWMLTLKRADIPCLLINGRMSARSARGYRRLFPLLQPALGSLTAVLVQNRAAARRLWRLGAPQGRTQVVGNLKFDLTIEAELLRQAKALRQSWGERPVWLAASTHDDEELRLLQLHQQLRQHLPTLLLVLIPRHSQRFAAVAALVTQQGLTLARRSLNETVVADSEVYLGDTMGEALLLMATADLVVMGGTFIDHGGQNPLEAAALAKPVLLGPSVYNFPDAVPLLLKAGGAVQVATVDELAPVIGNWLDHPEQALAAGERGAAVVAANRGALQRTLAAVEKMLPTDLNRRSA